MNTRDAEVLLRSGAVVFAVVCLGFEGPGGFVPYPTVSGLIRHGAYQALAWGTGRGRGRGTAADIYAP